MRNSSTWKIFTYICEIKLQDMKMFACDSEKWTGLGER